MKVTIFHNPNCGTSRSVLAAIRERGIEPEVIEYLKTPPTRERLRDLLGKMDVGIRDVLRRKGTPYEELGLDDPSLTDEQILDAVMANPILIERPIVETMRGARLCRPAERLQEIL